MGEMGTLSTFDALVPFVCSGEGLYCITLMYVRAEELSEPSLFT